MTDEDEFLAHVGVLHKSGRYPWGSGKDPHQRNKQFLDHVEGLRKQGMSEVQIAEALGIKTSELRAAKSIAKNEQKQAAITQAQMFSAKGMSNVAIGERMGIGESQVRALLNPSTKEKNDILQTTATRLKEQIGPDRYLDVGAGTQFQLDISETQLRTAVAMLREEGYKLNWVKVPQVGTNGKYTTIKALSLPDANYSDIVKNPDRIKTFSGYSDDGGRSVLGIKPPVNIDSKRIAVRYKEEGGAEKDGVIELRRGVDDISLGGARYAQVRVAVDGTHYLKGMAMYADDLPPGVDMRFNTNKSNTGNKLDAMKSLKTKRETGEVDQDNPFGAVVHQREYLDKAGNKKLSAMNIVNEEGDWTKWSTSLSSQVLSKQSSTLAKKQLDLAFKSKQDEYNEIIGLTNPTIKKKLLESFADGADSSAVHLKAAGLPRQATKVILPISSMKENEIYAPTFNNGEKVALVRYPHGGTFEIPELTVNNRHPEASRVIGNDARDAVGIHHKVAERLSGADFDGDTVLVIPNNNRAIRNSPPLAGLKNFDPKTEYKPYDGMKTIDGGIWNEATKSVDYGGKAPSGRAKQQKMGDVSNLITDMTVQKAPHSEIVRAVRHSMVVIDAEKHSLNYKQSYLNNGIAELKTKYQGSAKSGASTLISRASSSQRVPDRKLRSAKYGGPIDPKTGKKVYENIDSSYVNAKGKTIVKTVKSTKMAEADDARKLISPSNTVMENVYADHANKLKALANDARKSYLQTPNLVRSPSARTVYAAEYDSLKSKLNIALKNAPLERQAQLVANAVVSAKKQANPEMDAADLKKIKGQALGEARVRTGAAKERVHITPREWEAIQAGAISNNFLEKILDNTDLDRVKELATPRATVLMTPNKVARAKAMVESGHSLGDVATALGVSPSTLDASLNPKEG